MSVPIRTNAPRAGADTASQEPRAHDAALAPEYSLLVCGRTRTITTDSNLEWHDGFPGNRHVQSAVLDLLAFPDSPVTLFHYIPPGDTPAGALPPLYLHKALNLTEFKSGFLFVHDASDREVEESILCLRQWIELLYRHGGRGFWVVVNTPAGADNSELADVDSLVARFEEEFAKWPELNDFSLQEPSPRVLKMSTEGAYCVVGDAILAAPRLFPPQRKALETHRALSDREFWSAFLNSRIVPWKHEDYLRAAFLTLIDRENQDLGLLEIATKFAAKMNAFKQRNSQIQLQPESRTLTVFWLYHVKLAIVTVRAHQWSVGVDFKHLFEYIPELRDQKLATTYYSPDILRSEFAERLWMLPNLRPLPEQRLQKNPYLREQMANQAQEDPERLLRFVFAVVQRYLRPGETRRRSWFINLAFAAFQQQTMRLRATKPWISVYSETHAYFYLQLAHAALSHLRSAGRSEYVQAMSYPLFRKTFDIKPSVWKAYYTEQLWNSLQARAGFLPPDIAPLRDTIQPASTTTPEPASSSPDDPNLPFRKLGLVPELPSLETLHFHQAILLEDAKALKPTLKPSDVTTHPALLKYIHTHIIIPSLSTPSPSIPTLIRQHLTLLSHASLLPTAHITALLTLTLHHLTPVPNPDFSPPVPPRPSGYLPPGSVSWTPGGLRYGRAHNCPCHAGVPLPYDVGPDAVKYPGTCPYDHAPQVMHGCECHGDVEVEQDAFAALCAQGFEEFEVGEKSRRGEGYPGREREGVGEWEKWVRTGWGLMVCWEGVGALEVAGLEGKGLEGKGAEGQKGRKDEEGAKQQEGGKNAEGLKEDGVKEEGATEHTKTEEGKGKEGDNGESGRKGIEVEDDEKTLAEPEEDDEEAGSGGEQDDEWEVLSQHTLC